MNNENRYYVYVHRDLSGVVFYVGSGAGARIKSKCNRSEKWLSVSASGYTSEKLCDNLDIDSARELECLLIQMFCEGELVNKHLPNETLEITPEILVQFRYCENSPSGLIWDVGQPRGAKPHKVGDIAGSREYRDGEPHRWRVKPAGVKNSFTIHRIIWALHHPIGDSKLIDHIDGNPHNNKISNLREVDFALNARNMKKSRSNKSGVTGVHFKTNQDGCTYWVASWRNAEGKQKSKNFMTGCYGYDEAFKLACDFRHQMITELNNKGHDYSRRNES